MGCSPRGCKELGTTERLTLTYRMWYYLESEFTGNWHQIRSNSDIHFQKGRRVLRFLLHSSHLTVGPMNYPNSGDCRSSSLWRCSKKKKNVLFKKRFPEKQWFIQIAIWIDPYRELGFPCGSADKEFACNARDLGSIPGLGRSPGKGKDYPLQYSVLENSMECIVRGVKKSQIWQSNLHFHIDSYRKSVTIKFN